MNLISNQTRREAQHAVAQKHRAIEPMTRFCHILQKEVTVLVDYPDYVSVRNKGKEADIYCEEIVECYRGNVRCRYSGISPSYTDPFVESAETAEEHAHVMASRQKNKK